MKTFKLIDYKGKHFIIQDKLFELDYQCFYPKTISKKKALEKDFIEWHKDNCEYYGIPCYIGDDKDMLKVYK